MSDPPASDLGPIRERLERTIQQAAMNCRCPEPRCTLRDVAACEVNDLRALLAAYDAQAARLAAVEQVVDIARAGLGWSPEPLDVVVARIRDAIVALDAGAVAAGEAG